MPTLRGRALLGWMSQSEGLKFLRDECYFNPQLSEAEALEMWRSYRQTVEALPERVFSVCPNLGLSMPEVGHLKKFLGFLNSQGPHDILGVQKVDLRDLVVRQYFVVTDRAAEYAAATQTGQAWLDEMLPTSRKQSQMQIRAQQSGLSTYAEIDIPHAEFFFAPNPMTGQFSAAELLRHVTMMQGDDRSFLWAGYHRSFAKCASTPAAAVPSAVVAVARNVMTELPVNVAPGVETAIGVDPFCPFGAKAARFGDFFVDGLFIDVDLRKKRYQLQISANWVALNEDAA